VIATRPVVVIALPAVLIATMYALFRGATAALGFPLGYAASFAVYWIGWCVAVPVAILGPRRVRDLFRERPSGPPPRRVRFQAALWWPLIAPLVFAFIPRVASVSASVLFVSVGLGIVTGVAEEILWRGLYMAVFPKSVWLNSFYPSLMFGIWHLCPLSVLPSRYPGGIASFAFYSVALGLSYSYSARLSRSIRWCSVSHAVHDALGLGGLVYAVWL
jgi:hypothetical protein